MFKGYKLSNFDLNKVKALTWDVGGTIFDWHYTIKEEITNLSNSKSKKIDTTTFTNKWRFKMFELLSQHAKEYKTPWKNAVQLHLEALDIVLDEYNWNMSINEKKQLNTIWHKLKAWPDAPETINKLRNKFQVTVLTVLSTKIAISSSKHNNISWDGIFSCEFLGSYKPNPKAYLKAVELLGLYPEEVMMCAAHENDLKAAGKAGLRTAYNHVHEEQEVVKNHYILTNESIGLDANSGKKVGKDSNNMIKIPPDNKYDIVATNFKDLTRKLLI